MKVYEVSWRELASVQVKAENRSEAAGKAMIASQYHPEKIKYTFDDLCRLEVKERTT